MLCSRTKMHISDQQKVGKLPLQHTSHTTSLASSIITVTSVDQDPLTSVIILENPECWLTFLVYKAPFNVKQEDIKWHMFNIAPSLSFELCKKFLWSLCLNTMSGIEIKTLLLYQHATFSPPQGDADSLSLYGQAYLIYCQVVYRLSSESYLQLYVTSEHYSFLNSIQIYLLASMWFHQNFHSGSHSPTLGFTLKFFWKRTRNEPVSFSPITPYMHLILFPPSGRRCLHF